MQINFTFLKTGLFVIILFMKSVIESQCGKIRIKFSYQLFMKAIK